MQLIEQTMGTTGRIDWQNHIVRGVKIVGTESRNGYGYSPSALQRAASLYEGVTVNISHPGPKESPSDRSILDSPGWLTNIRFERDGLYGDLNLFESHPATSLILEKANKNSRGLGLSQVANGFKEKIGGRMMVTRIDKVYSVDLVGIPATTAGLFESLTSSEVDRAKYKFLRHRGNGR